MKGGSFFNILWIAIVFLAGKVSCGKCMADPKVEFIPIPLVHLGEGPHWNAAKQELYYVDLTGQAIHRYIPSTGKHFLVKVCQEKLRVTFVIPVEGEDNKYVIGVGRTIQLMEWDGLSAEPQNLTLLHSVEEDTPTHRFNDAKCDVHGRLWAGTMDDANHHLFESYLYRVTNTIQSKVDKVSISNGIAWSKDSTQMYFVDTSAFTLVVFDYDLWDGSLGNKTLVYDFKANNETCDPDGMEIDSDGNLWVACWAGYQIIHISPSGQKLGRIEMPVKHVTSLAFGGPDMDIMYVTSAQDRLTPEEVAKQPHAGGLFKITDHQVKGLRKGFEFNYAPKQCDPAVPVVPPKGR